jgi:serine/threonine protein kinase
MPPGYLLRNRYRIERHLAAGGFGETYLAIDEDYPHRRRVVVKHLKPQSNDPAVLKVARQLFDTEGVILANLGDKTNRIPTLYAYFEENRQFYLVQEWIEGQTLTQELGTRRLSETETLSIVREILAVLTEVHTKSIIHRDLKPDNIIRRSRDRQLVLIDFGAVKAVRQTSLNATHSTRSIGIGTAGYMPSEQAMGYPTSASDIYAVGAIALQCLTGQPPSQLFDEDALVLKWRHICKVSDRTANILAKMVAPRHLDRYANAMEEIKAIDSLLAPVAPSKSTPTIKFHPTPAPPAQPQKSESSKPSRIGNYFVLKCLLGFIGFNVLVYVGSSAFLVHERLNTPSVEPLSTEISETDDKSAKQKSDRGDYQGALADYDLAIKLAPSATNYKNRALLRDKRLQDYWGALDDYNSAILLQLGSANERDPSYAVAYNNRGVLQHRKFKDKHKALSDYDEAIALNPNYATAYYNRSILHYYEFSDRTDAIDDMKQAAFLDRKQDNKKDYQKAIAQLKKWGVTENIPLFLDRK